MTCVYNEVHNDYSYIDTYKLLLLTLSVTQDPFRKSDKAFSMSIRVCQHFRALLRGRHNAANKLRKSACRQTHA